MGCASPGSRKPPRAFVAADAGCQAFHPCAQSAQRAAAERLRPNAACDLDRPRRRPGGRRRCPRRSPTGTAATTGSPGSACTATASSTRVHGGARALRRRRVSRSCSAPRPRASARPRMPTARSMPTAGTSRPTTATRSSTRRIRWPTSSSTRSALEGRCVTVSTACSSSAKVFAHGGADAAPRPGRRGDRRRRRHAVRQRPVRLQRAAARLARAVPAVRRGAQRHQHRRSGAASRCSSATPAHDEARACSATANRATRTTCRRRIPTGLGAERALDDALARAGIDAGAIDYINLHGTASAKNDEVEAALVARRFPARRTRARPRAVTGHTLGAAGIVEAAVTPARDRARPGARHRRTRRTSTPRAGRRSASTDATADVRVALSNSFGFGGNNCVSAPRPQTRPRREERDERRAPPVRRRRRLLGADAARLGSRARGVARRGGAARARRPSARRPSSSPPPSAGARPTPSPSRSRSRRARCEHRGRDPSDVASVFTSAHGDLAINDYMCATLASEPTLISPTRSTTRCTTPPPATGRSPPAATSRALR